MVRGLPTCYTLPPNIDPPTNEGKEGIVEGLCSEAKPSGMKIIHMVTTEADRSLHGSSY